MYLSIVKWIRKMPYEQKKNLRKFFRGIIKFIPFHFSLRTLAMLNGSDKLAHGYIPYYENHFKAIKNYRLKILEIGIGGYHDPLVGGESLRLWSDYFRKSIVYGIDINDKSPLKEKKIKIFTGSQNDPDFLTEIAEQHGPFDIIIDDGSHISEHVITSFKVLFSYLNNDGIYVVEDLHTSYWPQFYVWKRNDEKLTSINYIKSLIDSLNSEFIPNREQKNYDKKIKSVHFYGKMVFIHKGVPNSILFPYMREEIKKAEKMLLQKKTEFNNEK